MAPGEYIERDLREEEEEVVEIGILPRLPFKVGIAFSSGHE